MQKVSGEQQGLESTIGTQGASNIPITMANDSSYSVASMASVLVTLQAQTETQDDVAFS